MKILLSVGGNDQYYIDAIKGAGAEAVAKYSPDVDLNYDGLILCGGCDIDPQYYGEEICGSVGIDDKRDASEMALLRAYVEAGKPVLGICRGCQLINVFFGGSLYQHLPETHLHKGADGVDAVHNVKTNEGTILYNLYGDLFMTNSSHHQAIKDLGKNICAAAYWNGQYIEAIEHIELPIFAVQWHPERMYSITARGNAASGKVIFEYFISLCEKLAKV